MWSKGNPFALWWECKSVQPLWKTIWRFLKKIKTEIPYDPIILLLGIYPKTMKKKNLIRNDICTPMLIAALFTIPNYGSNLNVHQ